MCHLICRRIEDKYIQHHMDLRPFHLGVNLSALHGNCEQPQCYQAWLAVMDCTLPQKGVQYRLLRSGHQSATDSPSKVAKEDINVFPD